MSLSDRGGTVSHHPTLKTGLTKAEELGMKIIGKMMFGALMGASVLAISATGASARVVCNEDGDCWHAKSDYAYRPEFRVTIHPDDWRWKEGEKYKWREHEGRGYWRRGEWTDF